MKNSIRCISLLLSAVLLLAGCTTTKPPVDTGGLSADDTTPIATEDTTKLPETEDSTVAPDTEPIEDDFDPAADTRFGAAVNVDCDEIVRMVRLLGADYSNLEDKCRNWFNTRYNTGYISDLLYNIDQVVPTESRSEWFDYYLKAQQTGAALDATTDEWGRVTNAVYNEHGVNPYEIWIEQCHENGINPWLSFRMNDTHAASLGYACQDFFYEAEKNGWQIGLEAGRGKWNQYCFDYSVPEVRAYFSEYIDEILGKFDVYGIELDFQRNLYCFKTESVDNCQYMNLFIEEVNRIISKYEQQYGHEIKLMVRIARDLEQNRYFGFDVVHWAENDWIDVVVPASYFGKTDARMPIAAWKEALADYPVEVYAGVECHTISQDYAQTASTLAGYTAMYLQQGADKMYLYNLFSGNTTLYRICSSLENAFKCAKRIYLTVGQDTVPQNSGFEIDDPFPMQIRAGKSSNPIVIPHGRLNTKKETYIFLGVSKMALNEEKLGKANIKVTYNGVECEYKGLSTFSYVRTDSDFGYMLLFKVPDNACRMAVEGKIQISTEKSIRVLYMELLNGQLSFG